MMTHDTAVTEYLLPRDLGGDFLLWPRDIQADSFLDWDEIWATRTIKRGTPKPLPHGRGISLATTWKGKAPWT